MSNELAIREEMGLTTSMVEPGEIMRVISHVHKVVKDAMKEGIDGDYGIIPGTVKKTLLKPGAEKLLLAFGLAAVPRSPHIVDLPNGHREVTIETEIVHMKTGSILTVGLGSCSTMEGKYRFRKGDLICPECGNSTIIKGKAEFGGGWLCYAKKGGCGAKWTDDDNPFSGVSIDRVEHDNPADYYNTVLKMASKRSMIDGAIRATASSSMFTQDMDEAVVPEKPENGKPPISQPKEKAAPAEHAGDNKIISCVDSVGQRIVKNKATGKESTVYVIHAGEKYETFSETYATEAKAASEAGLMVEIEYTEDKYGRKIKTMNVLEPAGREPGQEG